MSLSLLKTERLLLSSAEREKIIEKETESVFGTSVGSIFSFVSRSLAQVFFFSFPALLKDP
jgi:hypothetical protein